jgi:hypothetical protein
MSFAGLFDDATYMTVFDQGLILQARRLYNDILGYTIPMATRARVRRSARGVDSGVVRIDSRLWDPNWRHRGFFNGLVMLYQIVLGDHTRALNAVSARSYYW